MNTLVGKLQGVRVLVVGDVMLDETWLGDATRLSPEAPVPVVHVQASTNVLGGAANTAANARALGGQVELIGCVGRDSAADICLRLAGELGLKATWVEDPTRPTTVKTRIVARGHQIVRADRESVAPIQGDALQALCEAAREGLERADVLVLSDYSKGVLHPPSLRALIDLAVARNVPVVVDPKARDFAVYRGATVLTPNTLELAAAAGHAVSQQELEGPEIQQLLETAGVAAILATRGADGMSLVRPATPCVHIASAAKQVFDVTGAGDTVVATLALCIGAGMTLEQGMLLATIAAGEVVSKRGTALISSEELSVAASALASSGALRSLGPAIWEIATSARPGARAHQANS